jgi:hypothetical protein
MSTSEGVSPAWPGLVSTITIASRSAANSKPSPGCARRRSISLIRRFESSLGRPVIRRRGQAFTKHERMAILATFDANQNLTETARVHGVSPAGVLKLVRLRRDGGEGGIERGDKGKTALPVKNSAPRGNDASGGIYMSAPGAEGEVEVGATPSKATPPLKGRLQRRLEATGPTLLELEAAWKAKAPDQVATTTPSPALTLVPSPERLSSSSHPSPPTQSESKTRANSWELVGSIALASKAVLQLFHNELSSPLPDGRSLNEFASILQKLHISYGITVEKARLLHNESTGIIAKVEDLSKLPEGVTLDVAIAFVRGTIHGKLPA